MQEAVELQGFYIDTVQVASDQGDLNPKIQMIRYTVLAKDGEDALRRFFEDEAGVVCEETEPTDLIVVGMSLVET